MTKYDRAVLKAANDNHIWLNAFACVHPTDKLRLEIGQIVLDKLHDTDALIDSEPIGTFTQKILILRVNKS